MRHIISLSTIPPRFGLIGGTLASLLQQKRRPEAIRLYIPRAYRRFPDYAGEVPQVPDGVEVVRVDDDLGPASKVLFAARDLRGQAVDILYCDDDHHYSPGWSAGLLAGRARHPEAAVAAAGRTVASLQLPDNHPKPQPQARHAPVLNERLGFQLRRLWAEYRHRKGPPMPFGIPFRTVVRSGYTDIAEGYRGVAIRPDFLDDVAFEIPPVMWSVDDIWLSGMMARRGIDIWAEAGPVRGRVIVQASAAVPLFLAEIDGARRREANRACALYLQRTYGIWGGAGGEPAP